MQDAADQPWAGSTPKPPARKRGPPAALRIDTPALESLAVSLAFPDSSATSSADPMSSATSDNSDFIPFNPSDANKPRPVRNMKRLSLSIPSAQSSTSSLAIPPPEPQPPQPSVEPSAPARPRRLSVASLPGTGSATALLRRQEEDGSPTVPYADGPIQIIPGIWLGSEDNARDWQGLMERGIKSILNVAKEVSSPFDAAAAQPLRPFSSTPLGDTLNPSQSTYYPPHVPSGRPGMHYLKMQWSHGQADLVQEGFPVAMNFVDQALERGEGVLVHCQCGISRSATMVIALVMRAAIVCSSNVPPEVWELKGMHAAYAFVKEKSKHVGPNMSLMYQLMAYERALKPTTGDVSPSASDRSSNVAEQEEEWGRRRMMLDDAPSDTDDEARESAEVVQEALALDKAMEDRILARKSSASSVTSSAASSGLGMGLAWKNRYGSRRRAGSVASNFTTGSLLSEELVEEDEEEELLGVGGGFDGKSPASRGSSMEPEDSPEEDMSVNRPSIITPLTARPLRTARPPPSAPAYKTSFGLPPPSAPHHKTSFGLPPAPLTAFRTSFDLSTPRATKVAKPKRRPAPLGLLPPVPSSPDPPLSAKSPVPMRLRTKSKRPTPPPLALRLSDHQLPINRSTPPPAGMQTPSQTLFVFPPSPNLNTRTPSTMTLMSNFDPVPFPLVSPPRVATVKKHGRTTSFIGIAVPPTPTTACSRVDARGYFGQS